MKLLVNGCSLTADCGFNDDNLEHLWVNRLGHELSASVDNIGFGGSSNARILERTVCHLSENTMDYDMVIIEWSGIHRCQLYRKSPIWDTAILNATHTGNPKDEMFAKMLWANYNNTYMLLNEWLTQMLLCEAYLVKHNIPYAFVLGFDNWVSHINTVSHWQELNQTEAEEVYDIRRYDDEFIDQIWRCHKEKMNIVAKFNWINFDKCFMDYKHMNDKADDKIHPGQKTNFIWKNLVLDYLKAIDFIP